MPKAPDDKAIRVAPVAADQYGNYRVNDPNALAAGLKRYFEMQEAEVSNQTTRANLQEKNRGIMEILWSGRIQEKQAWIEHFVKKGNQQRRAEEYFNTFNSQKADITEFIMDPDGYRERRGKGPNSEMKW